MNEARLNVSLMRSGCARWAASALLLPLGAAACGGADNGLVDQDAGDGARRGLGARGLLRRRATASSSSTRTATASPTSAASTTRARATRSAASATSNHDGKPDLYEYFDDTGTVRRREFCYDDTGVVNAIEHYEGGKLVRREYDAAGQHRIDTWDCFDPSVAPDPKTGRPAHPSGASATPRATATSTSGGPGTATRSPSPSTARATASPTRSRPSCSAAPTTPARRRSAPPACRRPHASR